MKRDELKLAYQIYYQPLFLYALTLSRNQADAEDLVENTFLKALLSYQEGHLKAWLFQVLKNEYYQMYHKKKRFVDEADLHSTIVDESADVLKTCIMNDQKRWLYEQIYQLPARDQEIMLLTIQGELEDQEISQIMHLSVEHIRVIRHRVKKKLMDLCQKEGII